MSNLILGIYDPNKYFIVTTESVLEPLGVKVTDNRCDLLPPTRDNEEEVPGRHGAIDFGAELQPRLLELTVYSPDGMTALQKNQFRRNCARYLNPMLGQKKLIFMDDPGIVYNVRYAGKITPNNHAGWIDYSIPFKMYDPLMHDEVEKSLVGDGTIENNGSFETSLIIEITGNITNPTIIIGGVTLSYAGTISAGQNLVIDTFHKTAKIGNTNVLDKWVGIFPKLQPGETEVTLAPMNVTFRWTEKYL